MVYPTLTEYGAKDFSIQPGLAESWTESPGQNVLDLQNQAWAEME